ncbi:MAG TPA: SDR family oxidoreductase [Bacilli bacterium]
MKLLIVGGNGMAGHMLVQYFHRCSTHSVYYTTRDKKDPNGLYMDAGDAVLMEKVVESVSADVVINCIGIMNQYAAENPVNAYWINGLLPHRLKRAAEQAGGRLIHISTDCVFSGEQGEHTEADQCDGTSVYALSKALGEVREAPHLTIRTSIIGPEIRGGGIGLMDWFMRQDGLVKGYENVLWNGVTTLELAKAIDYCLGHPQINGCIHLCSKEKINKYELLKQFQKIFDKKDVTVEPDGHIRLDRTLLNTRTDFAYAVTGYAGMLTELSAWMRSP